jgi:hypothetical protein
MFRSKFLRPYAGHKSAGSSKMQRYNAERCNPNFDRCEILSCRFLEKFSSCYKNEHCHGGLVT